MTLALYAVDFSPVVATRRGGGLPPQLCRAPAHTHCVTPAHTHCVTPTHAHRGTLGEAAVEFRFDLIYSVTQILKSCIGIPV